MAERDSNTARLDFPVRTETADCVVTERNESEYRNLFDRINKELRAEKKRADDKTKDELKALEKMDASDPEILLDGYIKSVVNKELQHAGVMADDGPVNRAPQENTTATKVVEAIADAKSKKRLFPWRGPGERKGLFVQAKQGQGQRKKLAKARARTRVRRAVPRTKKRPQAKARARSPTRVESWCEHGLTQGAPCSTAFWRVVPGAANYSAPTTWRLACARPLVKEMRPVICSANMSKEEPLAHKIALLALVCARVAVLFSCESRLTRKAVVGRCFRSWTSTFDPVEVGVTAICTITRKRVLSSDLHLQNT